MTNMKFTIASSEWIIGKIFDTIFHILIVNFYYFPGSQKIPTYISESSWKKYFETSKIDPAQQSVWNSDSYKMKMATFLQFVQLIEHLHGIN